MPSKKKTYSEDEVAIFDDAVIYKRGDYVRFFRESHVRGEWPGSISAELAASYLMEQLGLAVSQRAAGRSRESVRDLFTLSLSVLQRV